MGLILAGKGQIEEAKGLFRQNLADQSGVRGFDFIDFARVLEQSGLLDEAVQVLDDGMKKFPRFCALHDNAAKLSLKLHREVEAYSRWAAANRIVPKCDHAFLSYGKALLSAGKSAEAAAVFQELLRNSPSSDGAAQAKALAGSGAN